MPYQTVSINAFEGLNEDENPHSLGNGELTKAVNIARYGNSIGTRPGTRRPDTDEDYDGPIEKTTDSSRSDKPVQGAFEYRKNFDEGRVLITILDDPGTVNMIYKTKDTQLTSVGVTITAGATNFWTFAVHRNVLWAAGGASTDHIWTWNGAATSVTLRALTEKNATSTRLYPKYIFAWRNYLLMNGLRGGTSYSNNPAATRFADFGEDPTENSRWSDGNTLGFSASRVGSDTFGESFTTGFGSYKDNRDDVLLVLSNKKITGWVLDNVVDFRQSDVIANGCATQRAFVDLGVDSGDAIYLSPRGTIHSLRQSQAAGVRTDSFLSWKIRETTNRINLSNLHLADSAYDPINGRVLFGVPTGSNAYLDTILMLDVKGQSELTAATARWYIWNIQGMEVTHMGYFRDSSSDGHIYFFGSKGDVAWVVNDTFSDIDDSGTTTTAGYTAELQTKHNANGDPSARDTVGDVTFTLQPGGSYSPTYKTLFDYGQRMTGARYLRMPKPVGAVVGTDVVGTGVIGADSVTRDEKVYGTGKAQTISHNIQHAGKNEPFRVSQITYQIRRALEDTGSIA